MANGVLYSTAGTRRAVVALDPNTGEMLWMHSEQEGQRGAAAPRQLSGRGLAYWTDGKEERIIYVTPGYRLIALDAKTGKPVAGFGKNGIVDLKLEDDQKIEPINGEIGLQSTPIVAKERRHRRRGAQTGREPQEQDGTSRATSAAYDARTGKRLWIFHTIPQPGEFGNDTWEKDSWAYTGNTGVWGQISRRRGAGARLPAGRDADRRLLRRRSSREQPVRREPRRRRSARPASGSGITSWCITASGTWTSRARRSWSTSPSTAGRSRRWRSRPSRRSCTSSTATTGQPVWPIEERPVPKGDVPGEWYSPTQPFPTKPPAYDRQGVSIDDLIDFTPELRAEAVEAGRAATRSGPIFTPPVVSKADGPMATLAMAAAAAATNWPGGSLRSGNAHPVRVVAESRRQLGLVPPPPAVGHAYVQACALARPRRTALRRGGRDVAGGGGPAAAAAGEAAAVAALDVQGLPIMKPPYGRISAIDLNKGDILWQVPHGETPDNIRNNPPRRV